MKPEHQQLMHEVLDGEASADDVRVLEAVLAADPAARTEYEQLQRLFAGLNSPRNAALPEDLVAGVLDKMPRHPRDHRVSQLSSRWRVFRSDLTRSRGRTPTRVSRPHRDFPVELNTRNANMNEKTKNRALWIGGGIAVVVLIIVSKSFDNPSTQDISGTIAPAHRAVAQQPGAADVTSSTAGQSGSSSTPAGASADAAIDAARSDAAKADAARFDAAKADAAKADAARFDAAKADAAKADAAKFDAAKRDAIKADAAKFDAAKSDAAKLDAAKADAAKANAAKADAARAN
jgi:anti-sigma factor RsiW